jgi:hypothetical protein
MADKNVRFSITAQNKTAKTFQAIKSSVMSLNKSVLGLGATIAGAAGLAGFGAMAKGAMDTADKIHKLNIRLGASTEALSQYRHVADMSGVSFDTLTMGWQRMTRRVAEAANDTGEARGALEELGISAVELAQLKPEEQFEILADAIRGVESPADRVRLAMKLFDSEGVSLLQMMEGGAEGLRSMRDEADRLGMTLSKTTVTNIALANDAIAKVTSRVNASVMALVGEMAPALIDVAEGVGGWIDANRELIGQNMKTVLSALAITGKTLIPVFKFIGDVFQIVGQAIAWVSFKIYELLDAFNAFESISAGWSWIKDVFGMEGGAPAAAAPSGAAAIAAAGGGPGFTGQDAVDFAFGMEGSGSGATVVNNFNTQITRSDAVAIAAETDRVGARQ